VRIVLAASITEVYYSGPDKRSPTPGNHSVGHRGLTVLVLVALEPLQLRSGRLQTPFTAVIYSGSHTADACVLPVDLLIDMFLLH
jgi:hypothetical protein